MSDNIDLYKAYSTLISRHKEVVWAICWKHCHGNRERCRDLVQEVSLVLWTRIDRLRPGASFYEERQWVSLSTRNVLYNLRRHPSIDLVAMRDSLAEYLADDDSHAQISETLQELISFLNTDDQRFISHYLQGYKRHELAEHFNLKPNSVNKRLQRIILRLQEINNKINNNQ